MCDTGRRRNTSEGMEPRKSQRRGPYKKWAGEESLTSSEVGFHDHCLMDQNVTEEDVPFTENDYMDSIQMDLTHVTDPPDASNRPSSCHTSPPPCDSFTEEVESPINRSINGPPEDFSPVLETDSTLDEILDELRMAAQQQKYDELADEISVPLHVVGEDVLQTEEDEILECSEEENDENDDPPLYPGCKRHLGVVVLLLCCFMIRFRLSQETVHHLLCLIHLLLPVKNCLVTSLYGMKRYLSKLTTFLPNIHYYCSQCYSPVQKNSKKCSNDVCLADLQQFGAVSYFIQLKLISQLKTFFRRKSFIDSVRSHRFNHLKDSKPHEIRDVYDAELYQTLYKSGLLSDPNNLSFSMNTDGVAIFKSSKVSMWPVYLLINELPLAERKARENMLVYGIWISNKKPIMWSFLKPLFDDLKELEEGVTLPDYDGKLLICKAALLTCTCDLPAKCLVTNSIQFNGKNGCWHCLQEGETYYTNSGGTCHIYPYNEADPAGPKRTLENVQTDVNECILKIRKKQKKFTTNGCKGPFWLMYLHYFNFVDGFVIDYMHGVCEGVTKLLINLWFGAEHRNQPFSIYKFKSKVNEMLTATKPTVDITRVPRSLNDLAFWKASEFRNFLLYWGVPILASILPPIYLSHFCLLVKAIYILSSETVSSSDVLVAETCLFEFVKNFSKLYSLRYMSMNVHQLVHLANCVKMTGPLFVNSCFIFEDINGFIVSHIHGTQGVPMQVIQTIVTVQAMPLLKEKVSNDNNSDDLYLFLDSLKGIKGKSWQELKAGIYAMDSICDRVISERDFVAIGNHHSILSSTLKIWYRTYFKASCSYVYALPYKRLIKRNQSVVKYSKCGRIGFGVVKYFAVVENPNKLYIAVINPFHLTQFEERDNIHLVKPTLEVDVLSVTSVLGCCIYVETGDACFVCEIPNKFEKD